MKRIFQSFPILALLYLYNMAGFAQSSLNLDFELTNYNVTLPRNWYVAGEDIDALDASSQSKLKHAQTNKGMNIKRCTRLILPSRGV